MSSDRFALSPLPSPSTTPFHFEPLQHSRTVQQLTTMSDPVHVTAIISPAPGKEARVSPTMVPTTSSGHG